MANSQPLEKCGKFLVAKLRDSSIDHADALLAGRLKSPTTRALQTEWLALRLPSERWSAASSCRR